jgi:hypothetical protein
MVFRDGAMNHEARNIDFLGVGVGEMGRYH